MLERRSTLKNFKCSFSRNIQNKFSYLDHHHTVFDIQVRDSRYWFAFDTFHGFMGGTKQPKLKVSFGQLNKKSDKIVRSESMRKIDDIN